MIPHHVFVQFIALKLRNFAFVLAELPAFSKPPTQFAKAVAIPFTNALAPSFRVGSACVFNVFSVPFPKQ